MPRPASRSTAARISAPTAPIARLLIHGPGRTWLAGLMAALVVTIPAWLSWLDPRLDLWGLDDAKNHLIRLYHITWLIERGVWYPRWVPDMFMGYGYPLLNFYAPGLYYVSWTLGRLLRLDVWDAFRAAGVAAALTGTAGVYALTVALWRRPALGVLAAVTLLYGPYVFQINLFKRADIPEVLALSLLPWLLLSLLYLWQVRTRGHAIAGMTAATTLGTAIVLTHNLTAMLAAGVAAAWVAFLLVVQPGWTRLGRVVLAGALAVGLSAFFWLPAIGESHAVHLEELWGTGGLDYRGWFIEPNGRSPRQQAPDNRQTRTGLIDLHLHYPHQLVAPPKLSLGQAGLGLLATGSLVAAGVGAWRRRPTKGQGVYPGSGTKTPAAGATPSWAGIPLLAVAAGSWYLTFAQSAPVWTAVPGLALLQFPWRLLGPLGICLAVAGAGALALPLTALENRWGRQGQWLGRALVAGAGALVLFNHTGDRPLSLAPYPERPIDGRTVVADERNDLAGVGTTSNREFLPRDVSIATYTIGSPRGRNVAERLFPEADWLGGLLYPLSGDLRVLGWRTAPLQIGVRVANDGSGPAQLAFHQLRFAGWRAWLDGQPLALDVAPYVAEQQATLGFMVVSVPRGEHTITLAFGPTPLRLAALGLTLATCLTVSGALLWVLGRKRRWPAPTALAAWAALIALPLYLTWRGVWPAFGPLVVQPVAAPQPQGGAWQIPDLQPGQGALLVNVVEAVRSGQAQVNTPSGPTLGPDKHADVRQLTVTDEAADRGLAGTSRREWLYLHPPSTASVDLKLPARRTVWFQAGLTLDPAVWSAPVGDGVRFQVTVTPLDMSGHEGAPVTVLDKSINPRASQEHRRWVPVEADLSPWAGSTVRLTLQSLHRQDLHFAWSGWGNPMVVVRETDRVRLPLP